jgi:carboxylate-amine ligase
MRKRPRPRLPDWARWNAAAGAAPWTVGIEEEAVLLDPCDGSVANRIDDVLAVLPPAVAARAAAETHACVVELRTGPHTTVGGATDELSDLRRSLDLTVRAELGLRVAAAGTHPLAARAEVAVSSGLRYREIAASMRALAYREPTMAQHVHVAVADGDAAIRALDGLREDLPLLLALSANSPYWRAADSGFASVRTPIFSAFPRTGIPRRFGSYAEYTGAVDAMVRSEAIPDPGFLWWDARLQPRLGTVEVRIMDAQSRVADAAALTAVVQCLVSLHVEGLRAGSAGPEVIAENRFVAARDGMCAELIDHRTQRRRPVREALAELLDECVPCAAALGCTEELWAAKALADDPGDERQRRHVTDDGLSGLPARLADEFSSTVRARPELITLG